jgi:hypothetical protein
MNLTDPIRANRLLALILVLELLIPGQVAHAQNKYDVLARTLQPYGALFYSKAITKGMQADLVVREAPPLATDILNQPVRVTLQMPNKLRIETTDPEHRMVLCRNGQKVWVYPRELAATITLSSLPEARGGRIPDFQIPLKEQQIVWLPVLFEILRFEPAVDSGGEPAWEIDFRLSPEVCQTMRCNPWVASVVVAQNGFQIRRLHVESGPLKGTIDVLGCRFETGFPAEMWEAGPELANDAAAIPAERFASALERFAAIPGASDQK